MKIKDFIKESDQLNEIGADVFGTIPPPKRKTKTSMFGTYDPADPNAGVSSSDWKGLKNFVAKTKNSPYKEPDPTSDTLPGEPGSGLERKDNSQAKTKNSPYKEPDPTSDTLPGEPGSGLERKDNSQAIVNTEKSKRDQAQRLERERQAELARLKANAGMKDDDYKTPPGSKRTAQDMALDKEYPYRAPDGRRLKYPHGDFRNAFHSSPDSRKAGQDNVIRGDRVGKRLIDQPPVTRRGDDDRR